MCEILDTLGMSQPAVSHHLKILKQAGLVQDSREGKWIYYSLNEEVFNQVFAGDEETLRSYAEPIRKQLADVKGSGARTNPEVCEKLTSKGTE